MRAIRTGLNGAGIPVESSKGEAGAGQEEINVRYAEALTMADRHAIVKNAVKEIAWTSRAAGHLHGQVRPPPRRLLQPPPPVAVAPRRPAPRSSIPASEHGMSRADARISSPGCSPMPREITCFLAPYVNSYKRFTAGTFAPTKAVWSTDNRTAGYRLVGEGSAARARRVPRRRRRPQPLPRLRRAARRRHRRHRAQARAGAASSAATPIAARAARDPQDPARRHRGAAPARICCARRFGDEVVDHYVHAARWEQAECDRRVTDWELIRGFERY